MISETCLSLIASSVGFILEFQSILIGGESYKLDNVNEYRLKEVFHSFETQWKVTKTREKCFRVLFKKHFAGKNSLDRYDHLLFIFKFNYEKFLIEKFTSKSQNVDSLKSTKSLGIEKWIKDIQILSKRVRSLTIQNCFFQVLH
jgi:hypothetical protein